MFAEKSFCPPLTESYLREQTFLVPYMSLIPFKITIENIKLDEFELKTSLVTNQPTPLDSKMNVLNLLQNANNVMLLMKLLAIYQLRVSCRQMFWEKVIDWWNLKRSENINRNPTEVSLYGYKPESNSFHTFNHYYLISRYYVYLARNKFETPELEVIIVLLEIKIQCEREIAITNGNLQKYRNKWTCAFLISVDL